MSFDDDMFDGEPNPGYLEMPGGWCVPAGQIFASWGPLTAPRGGIKYPTRKETPVAKPTKKDIERELRLAEDLHAQLGERIPQLRAELAKAIPSEPAGGTRWSVEVKFAPHGKKYEFLLLRSPRGEWYTTGTSPHTKRFGDWAALVAWLEGPDVYWHSELCTLVRNGIGYRLADSAVVQVEGDPAF